MTGFLSLWTTYARQTRLWSTLSDSVHAKPER